MPKEVRCVGFGRGNTDQTCNDYKSQDMVHSVSEEVQNVEQPYVAVEPHWVESVRKPRQLFVHEEEGVGLEVAGKMRRVEAFRDEWE